MTHHYKGKLIPQEKLENETLKQYFKRILGDKFYEEFWSEGDPTEVLDYCRAHKYFYLNNLIYEGQDINEVKPKNINNVCGNKYNGYWFEIKYIGDTTLEKQLDKIFRKKDKNRKEIMKYYTPKIEEFHVGFKCEFKSLINKGNGAIVEQWEDYTIRASDFDKDSYNQITYESNWRVKYLDEQDILDLGFEYTNNDLDLIKKQDNKTIRIRYRVINDEPHLRIYEKSNRSYKDEWFPIFLGKIKNKSEIKKLLTHLETTR